MRKKDNWTLGEMVFGEKDIGKNGNLEQFKNGNMQICKKGNEEKWKLRKMEI